VEARSTICRRICSASSASKHAPVGPRRQMSVGDPDALRSDRRQRARYSTPASPRQAIGTGCGGRKHLAHRFDLLRAKGRLPPERRSWRKATRCPYGDLAHPGTCSRAISSVAVIPFAFLKSRRRASRFKRPLTAMSQRLATENSGLRVRASNPAPLRAILALPPPSCGPPNSVSTPARRRLRQL